MNAAHCASASESIVRNRAALTVLPCLRDAGQGGHCFWLDCPSNLTTLGDRFYCYSHLTGKEIDGTENCFAYCSRYTAVGDVCGGGVWLSESLRLIHWSAPKRLSVLL